MTLLHNGKGNDTVVSLYRRISAMQFEETLDRAEFLDLQAAFARELAGWSGSDHVPRNPLRVLLHAWTLRTDGQIDGKAAERGLHLPLDGVHLNSTRAKRVAEEFTAVIHNHRNGW